MFDCARYATHLESEAESVLRRAEKFGIPIRREYEPRPLNGESLHVTEIGNTTYFVLEATEDRLPHLEADIFLDMKGRKISDYAEHAAGE